MARFEVQPTSVLLTRWNICDKCEGRKVEVNLSFQISRCQNYSFRYWTIASFWATKTTHTRKHVIHFSLYSRRHHWNCDSFSKMALSRIFGLPLSVSVNIHWSKQVPELQ